MEMDNNGCWSRPTGIGSTVQIFAQAVRLRRAPQIKIIVTMETGQLCFIAVKGLPKLSALIAVKNGRLKLGYEQDGRLRIAFRKQGHALPVIAGTNGESLERLKAAIAARMEELK